MSVGIWSKWKTGATRYVRNVLLVAGILACAWLALFGLGMKVLGRSMSSRMLTISTVEFGLGLTGAFVVLDILLRLKVFRLYRVVRFDAVQEVNVPVRDPAKTIGDIRRDIEHTMPDATVRRYSVRSDGGEMILTRRAPLTAGEVVSVDAHTAEGGGEVTIRSCPRVWMPLSVFDGGRNLANVEEIREAIERHSGT